MCNLVGPPIVVTNSIVYGNLNAQVSGGNCNYQYSDVGDTTAGTGNLNVPPGFVSPLSGDFHLMSASSLRDQADPNATNAVDFDGNVRPQGLHSDMGADEVMP